MKIEWRIVLRDALAVLLLGFLGVRVGGALAGEENAAFQTPLAIVLMAAGFCVSGCLLKQARFKHLVLVAIGVWLIGTISSAISAGVPFVLPLGSVVQVFAAMLLGWLISLAIVRARPSAEPPAPPPQA